MTEQWMVTLAGQGWTFAAAANETVLQAGERGGVRLPSSCRNGTCRTCLCRLVSGAVQYKVAWPGVSAEEQRDGDFLPCVAVATTDLVIEAPAARRHGGTVAGS